MLGMVLKVDTVTARSGLVLGTGSIKRVTAQYTKMIT